jgi:hypothetical protein
MSEQLRKVRAAAVVALVFGVMWGTMLQLALVVSRLVNFGFTGRLLTVELWLQIYATFIAIGFVHGVLFSVLLGIAGRDRTVDTFPRWIGALIGGTVAFAGAVLIGIAEGGGGLVQAWPIFAAITSIGALSTTGLLTIARRGALPPPPRAPGQIGS